ncbi:MAG: SCP2 sterol-binding domain-containing protein [Candidatus Thorarchaeota archaeon]
MPAKDELHLSLEKMIAKIELPQNKKRFAKYNKTLQLSFKDNPELDCYIIFKDGIASIIDGVFETADLKITTTTETIMAIIDGTQSPTRAFMSGKVKATGPMNDLMKLQVLMK